jgi:hypothetical protein
MHEGRLLRRYAFAAAVDRPLKKRCQGSGPPFPLVTPMVLNSGTMTTLAATRIAMQVAIKVAIQSRDVLSYVDRNLALQPGLTSQ